MEQVRADFKGDTVCGMVYTKLTISDDIKEVNCQDCLEVFGKIKSGAIKSRSTEKSNE